MPMGVCQTETRSVDDDSKKFTTKVKLATFTKAGYGRNQRKRRCAKRVVHRNRNMSGLTDEIGRKLGRERREKRKETREMRILEKMELVVRIGRWGSSEPSGGADVEIAKDAPILALPGLSSLQKGTSKSESAIADPDKRYVCLYACVCVRVRGSPDPGTPLWRCCCSADCSFHTARAPSTQERHLSSFYRMRARRTKKLHYKSSF